MVLLRSPWRASLLVFFAAVLYLSWAFATRVVIHENDEGIYMDGALRILAGQAPYRDFFVLTGPGSFALEALSLGAFGPKLWAARVPPIFDLALMTSCLFWLTWKLSGRIVAILSAFGYLAFQTIWQNLLCNHRWDSSAWLTLAATLTFVAVDRVDAGQARAASALAGFAAVVAAFCTPPVAVAGLALALVLLLHRQTKALFLRFAAGALAAAALGAATLICCGALGPFLQSVRWTLTNYSGANRAGYGWVIGGYANLFHGISLAEAIVPLAIVTLPATLPFVTAMWLWKRPPLTIVVLLAAACGMLLSTYPRADLLHLKYISVLFYATAAPLAATIRLRQVVAVALLVAVTTCLALTARLRVSEPSLVTPAGTVQGEPADLAVIAMIQNHVRSSDTLFVFPYWPQPYFFTRAHNPTRYSFLQPGMFPDADIETALRQLQQQPPKWIVYMDLEPNQLLYIWPGSEPARLRIPSIEAFVQAGYVKVDERAEYRLLTRRTSSPPLAPEARVHLQR